ncbi:MAG: hypothetical protein RJS97_01705 [Parvibaculaceae bacterium]
MQTRAQDYQDIRYEVIDGRARISLARPQTHNAMTQLILEELEHALWHADGDPFGNEMARVDRPKGRSMQDRGKLRRRDGRSGQHRVAQDGLVRRHLTEALRPAVKTRTNRAGRLNVMHQPRCCCRNDPEFAGDSPNRLAARITRISYASG